jgi:hypothetical protein
MQIHTEFRGIPGNFTAKNTAEFRGIPSVFQKIPYSVGSQKRTSVDTLLSSLLSLTLPSLCRAGTCSALHASRGGAGGGYEGTHKLNQIIAKSRGISSLHH